MANDLYNQFTQQQQANNPMGQFNEMMGNPLQFLANRGINIPQVYANNPRAAVQYLITNGQMSNGILNNLVQKAQMMGYKF